MREGTPAWELSWREHTFAGVGSHAGATSNLASVGPTLASLDPRQREYPYFLQKSEIHLMFLIQYLQKGFENSDFSEISMLKR